MRLLFLGDVVGRPGRLVVQQLPAVPAEPHDERLDAIATDAGIVRPVED